MFNKSLATILSTFTKTAKELDEFVSRKTAEQGHIEQRLADLENQHDAISVDVRKAQQVRDQIKSLVGE